MDLIEPDASSLTRMVAREREALLGIREADPAISLDPFDSLFAASQYRYLYAETQSRLPVPSRVLDWGCGEGHFSHFLLSLGHTVTAYTLQHEPPLFGRLPDDWRRRFDCVRGLDPERLPLAAESFDAVFSVGVLEHVRENGGSELGSLKEILRILRPGGAFFCFHLPNRFSYIEAASRLLHGPGKRVEPSAGDRYHLYRYSPGQVRELFHNASFEVLLARRYGILPRNSVRRILGGLADSERAATGLNRLDSALERVLPGIAQNHMVVARRRA